MWEEDLDEMLVSLTKHEEQEEKDRLMHGAMKGDAGKKRRKKAGAGKNDKGAKGAAKMTGVTTSGGNKKVAGGKKPVKVKENKAPKVTPAPKINPTDLTLRQRLLLKNAVGSTGSQSLYKGMPSAQAESLKKGPGYKRPAAPKTTDADTAKEMFNQMNEWANMDEVEDPFVLASNSKKKPEDILKRRKYATEEEGPQ